MARLLGTGGDIILEVDLSKCPVLKLETYSEGGVMGVLEVPDTFTNRPERNKSDVWMWRYRGRTVRSMSYSYIYRYPDGREATAMEYMMQNDYSGPKPGAPVAIRHHVNYRGGFRETPKRVAKCRAKGKNRSRRNERRRARQELHAALQEV